MCSKIKIVTAYLRNDQCQFQCSRSLTLIPWRFAWKIGKYSVHTLEYHLVDAFVIVPPFLAPRNNWIIETTRVQNSNNKAYLKKELCEISERAEQLERYFVRSKNLGARVNQRESDRLCFRVVKLRQKC